ncbi:MAG: glycosyltransferase family 1 protein [Bacteroidota bacterium]
MEKISLSKSTIFINTLPVSPRSGGIRVFLLELIDAFANNDNPLFEYCLICCPSNKELFTTASNYPNIRLLQVEVDNSNPLKRIYFEQFKLNKLLNKQSNSILLNICNIALLKCNLPQVTIIQAQMSIKALRKTLPEKYISISKLHKIYYDLLLEKSIKISKKTIAISHYMVEFLDKFRDKIVIIHEGVNMSAFNDINNDLSAFKDKMPYILSVSTLFPHKNMDKLIEAFSIFKNQHKNDFKLLIAGKDPDGKQLDFLKDIAVKYNVAEDVFFPGWVANKDIPALYKNASLFVFLSGMEFFGLPILEAMACKIPVIAANKMSLPEVTNDAGKLVEPDDVNQVASLMEEICTNKELREHLIIKGMENVQEFKWATTAKKFEHVFESVLH